MLQRLALQQFVIVENSALEFGAGLNALTGETGAGKSILVDALTLLTGGRGQADWIRSGANRLVLEGVFDLHEQPAVRTLLESSGIVLDEEQLLIVRREINKEGRSRSFVNGRQVLVSDLRKWCAELVWIVGQGEQRALLSSRQQEQLLDRLARSVDVAEEYRVCRQGWMSARVAVDKLQKQNEEFRAQEDWLSFQVEELETAKIRPGEREELLQRRRGQQTLEEDLRRAEMLKSKLSEANDSVADHLESLLHALDGADETRWKPTAEKLGELRDEVRDLVGKIPQFSEELEFDPETIEARLLQLGKLERKYGAKEEGILLRLTTLREQLETGRSLDRTILEAENNVVATSRTLADVGLRLSEARRQAASDVEARIGEEFEQLGMPGASLEFQFSRDELPEGIETAPGAPAVVPLEGGLDRISLRFQSHESIEYGELGRVASGGELSRVLLALQAILGKGAPPRTWVFDEIDQGIGGETAKRVGDRLAVMSEHTQVLLVTHLPTVAALADHHQTVVKSEAQGRPIAHVGRVEAEARLSELARMLSGDPRSTIARDHAYELLQEASASRKKAAKHTKQASTRKAKKAAGPLTKTATKTPKETPTSAMTKTRRPRGDSRGRSGKGATE